MFMVTFAAEITLDGELPNLLTQAVHVGIGRQVFDLGTANDAGGVANFCARVRPIP